MQDDPARAPQQWMPFDYASPPDNGIMWVAVSAPETDCDVDDYGRTVGWHTGETEYTVCMVALSTDADSAVQFDPVDCWSLGKVPADGVVTHYMPVTPPPHPQTSQQASASLTPPAGEKGTTT